MITEAGNDPKVAGLVYISAFAPDMGESVKSLIKDPKPGDPVPPILPPKDGFLFLDRKKFRESFQRLMSKRAGAEVVEQRGSHAVYVSHPEAVAALVEKAATSLSASAA